MGLKTFTKRGWAVRITSLALAIAFSTVPFATAANQGRPRPVRVMTRNLYLGADLLPLAGATDPFELAVAGSAVWNQVLATNFPERARALAQEIRGADPALIGLQEVAIWRTGIPDGPPLFGGSPAADVVFDFLQSLLDELEALGTPYDVVVVQEEADVEVPTASGFDIRLTMRDVILARAGLPAEELSVSASQSANFGANLVLPILGGAASVTFVRGWTSVDVSVNRRSFRLVNAHLEAFANCIRTAQVFELLAGPLATALPVIFLGDLNSAPNDPIFNEPGCPLSGELNPYDVLIANGFADTWLKANPVDLGLTCCNASDLLNAVPSHTVRIDHVLARPSAAVYGSRVVGTDADNRTSDGLWPSDHAGVIAALTP